MRDLLESIDTLLGRLERESPRQESLEWYLVNNLRWYREKMQNAKTKQDVENATRVLSRFSSESMDWASDLFRECTRIEEKGVQLAKSWTDR